MVGVAKANAKAKAVAAWSNAGAGAKAEARCESKGERERGPRITGEESSGRRHGGSSRSSGSWPRVTRLCKGEGNGASLPKRKRTRRRSETRRGRDENREANARDHGSHGEERASQADREAVRGGVSCRLLGGGVSTPTSTKGVERPNDRSAGRHAAAHRPPSNFHKILFTPGCSDLSLPLFLPFSLSPYHRRLLQPYNVRPDRARISRVRDRIVLLPYLRKSALLRRAVLAYEPTRQPLPFASTPARASSTLRRRFSSVVRSSEKRASIGCPRVDVSSRFPAAIFHGRSNTLAGASCPRKIRERVSDSGKRRSTRLFCATYRSPYRKTGRSVSGRNPCECDAYRYAGSSHPG